MTTVLWEPMTDKVYGVFESEEKAREKYIITDDDYREVKDGVLWIALND